MHTDVGSARTLSSALLQASGMGIAPAERAAWALVTAEAFGRRLRGC